MPSLGSTSIAHQELPDDQVMDQQSTCVTAAKAEGLVCVLHTCL